MFGYVSRRIRHDCHVPDSSEEVYIESMDCLAWGQTVWFNYKGQRACVGARARGGARERVAVAAAVAALLLAEAPDDGDAQAGGVSSPFTVCVHSWFEVCEAVARWANAAA